MCPRFVVTNNAALYITIRGTRPGLVAIALAAFLLVLVLLAEFLGHTAKAKFTAANVERTFGVRCFREASAFRMCVTITPTFIVW